MTEKPKGTETVLITNPIMLYIKGLVAQMPAYQQDLFHRITNAQIKSVEGETDDTKKMVKMLALSYTMAHLGQDE